MLVPKAKDFVPDAAVKQAESGLQEWYWTQRFPKHAAHFEKALKANGGQRLVGQRCSYGQLTHSHTTTSHLTHLKARGSHVVEANDDPTAAALVCFV